MSPRPVPRCAQCNLPFREGELALIVGRVESSDYLRDTLVIRYDMGHVHQSDTCDVRRKAERIPKIKAAGSE